MPESPTTPRVTVHRARGGAADWEIRRFTSLDSTNRYLLDEARAGGPDRLVAVADHQSAGRGRLGRAWEALPGAALLVSALLRLDLAPEAVGLVTTAAGLALGDAVEAGTGFAPELKWPNDLVVADRKLAGILCEAEIASGRARAVIVGVGCNVRAGAVPPALRAAAVSCEDLTEQKVEREGLLVAFLDALDAWLGRVEHDPDAVVAAARSRSATIGRRVRVDVGAGRIVEGEAVTLAADGALVVRDDAGETHTVAVGDVVHLRPVGDR